MMDKPKMRNPASKVLLNRIGMIPFLLAGFAGFLSLMELMISYHLRCYQHPSRGNFWGPAILEKMIFLPS